MNKRKLENGERIYVSKAEMASALRHWIRTMHFVDKDIDVYLYDYTREDDKGEDIGGWIEVKG